MTGVLTWARSRARAPVADSRVRYTSCDEVILAAGQPLTMEAVAGELPDSSDGAGVLASCDFIAASSLSTPAA